MATSLRFDFLEGRNTANPAMRKAAAEATAMSTAMRVASATAAVGMVTLGAAVAGVAAHAIALGQSAILAVGAVALLPAALAGAVGTAIAGKIAFGGLGEAWKATGQAAAGGGASAVDVAHRMQLANRSVRDATQALTDAQREALSAQDALTRARETAAERLEDLSRSVRQSRLDERSATLAVQEARRGLAQAKGSGDVLQIKRAQLAYEESVLSLERAKDATADLAKTQAEAAAKGVEGSDEVTSAARRQEETQRSLTAATERLADAQYELARAGKSAGGATDKAAEALAKLAPSAAATVVALHALGPAWTAAGKGGQQATFDGVAADFGLLSQTYLPMTTTWLYRMGAAFNTAIRGTLQLATTNKMAADMDANFHAIASTVSSLAGSLRPFLNGFFQFVTVGSTFLPGLAQDVGSIAERFQAWAVAARESGRMQEWISTGLATLGQFWDLTKNVVMSVVGLFKAGENAGTLDGLVKGSAAMRAWVESAEGQEKISGFLTFLRDILADIGRVVPVVMGQVGGLSNGFKVAGVVIDFAASHMDLLVKLLPLLAAGFLIAKTAQVAANVAMAVSIPLRILEFAGNMRSSAAMRLHTAALTQNTLAMRASMVSTASTTVATTASDVATKRSLISMAAMRIATLAQAAANWILAPSTWAVLGPILLVVAAIALVVVVVILVIKYHKEIGAFFVAVWGHIWDFLKMIGAWFAGPFVQFFVDGWNYVVGLFNSGVAWVTGWVNRFLAPIMAIKEKIQAVGIWETLVSGFKAAVNSLITIWNKLDFEIGPFQIPSWVPFGLGGKSFHIADIFPDIPKLDVGGRVLESGMAVIHQGEEVVPAAEVTSRRQNSGGGSERRVVELRAGDPFWDMVLEGLRKAVGDRGGDVQFVIGR
jgi:hypothetical protein